MSNELQARVEKLEQSNKNLRLIIFALVLFALYGIKVAFFGGVPEVVQAQSFVVRSPGGVASATLQSDSLSFYTTAGEITVRLDSAGGNAGLFVHGKKIGNAPVVKTSTTSTP